MRSVDGAVLLGRGLSRGTGRPGHYGTIPAAHRLPGPCRPCHLAIRIQHPNDVPCQARREARPETDRGTAATAATSTSTWASASRSLAAVVILGVAVVLSYYNDHLAPVGSVDGQAITKDELRDRSDDRGLAPRDRRAAHQHPGRRRSADPGQAEQQTQLIDQQRQQLLPFSLERIIDNRIQADARRRGGRDRRRRPTSTRSSSRRRRPRRRATPGRSRSSPRSTAAPPSRPPSRSRPPARRSTRPSPTSRAARAGRTSPRTVSTDTATAPQAGDLGWLTKDDAQTDEAFLDSRCSRRPSNTPTDVVEGEDGIFRIGRVTEIAPEAVDDAYTDTLVNDGIDLAKYRDVVRGDVVRTKLEDKLVADATKPGPQRETAEIYLSQETVDLPDDAVKVRHILFSPKDDPAAAQRRRDPRGRPVVGPGQARRRRGLRPAQGRRRRVRRAGARGERRGERPRAPTAPAACSTPTSAPTAATSSRSRSRSSTPSRPTASSCRRSRPSSATTSSRSSATRPDLAEIKTADRWRRRLRDDRPRRLGRRRGGPGRGARLDRQGPARERLDDRDLRGADRQDVGRRHGRGRRPVPVPGRRRGGADRRGPPARGDPVARCSPTGTSPRRTP